MISKNNILKVEELISENTDKEILSNLERVLYRMTSMLKENDVMPRNISLEDEMICIKILKEDGLKLANMQEQTKDMCMTAVINNGLSIQYVIEQYREICLAAMNDNTNAFYYVKGLNK